MNKLIHAGTTLLLATIFSIGYTKAQVVAFPGAEGYGKNSTGGRGTVAAASKIFAVTSLADDAAGTTAGTLRWALSQTATYRTIVFRISGTIHLVAPLKITKPNVTIAGQTAPGDGICIADFPVSLSQNNIVIRYIRFRLGDKNQNQGMVNGSGDGDAFNGTGRNNIVVDHCTMSWSSDEACSFYSGDNITLQWNIISEPLNYSYHFETGDADFEHHGYGGIWGGAHATFHHNLIAHCLGRNPRFDGSRNLGDGATPGLENVDFRNNVIYNWGNYTVNGGEGGNYNIVNNYYKYGPSTNAGTKNGVSVKGMIINPFETSPLPYGKYFLSGNYVDGNTTITGQNWRGAAMDGGTLADTTQAKMTTEFSFAAMPTETAEDAYNSVMNKAGCVLPKRDTLDQRIMNDVLNRTGRIIDVQGGFPHGTAYAATVNAWPTLNSTTPPTDANNDNVADEWVAQRNLTGLALSGNGGYHTNGYTHLENYLNGDSIVAAGSVNNCITAKSITAVNSSLWIDAKDTTFTRLVSTDTNNVVASILDNGSFGKFTVSYYVTNTPRIDINNHAYLDRNVTILPATPVTSPVTVRLYFTVAEFNALKAADNTITSLSDLVVLKTPRDFCIAAMYDIPEQIIPTATGTYGTYQTGYYVEFTTSSFSTFFIGGKISFPVPVKLVNFKAVPGTNQVRTIWSTQNEQDVQQFMVERSNDAVNFIAIGSVNAGSQSAGDYAFTDRDPLNGLSYYRLRIVDKNGAYKYSQVVAVSIRSKNSIRVSPNPVTDHLVLSHSKAVAGAFLQVIGTDGKKIIQPLVNAGTTATLVDVSVLAKGVYIIHFINGAESQTTRFVKQ